MGLGATVETTAIGKTIIGLQIDEATLDNVDVYTVLDASHLRDLLIGRSWCEAPEFSYVKYENTLTYYNTIAFPFSAARPTADETEAGSLMSRKKKQLKAHKFTLVQDMVEEKSSFHAKTTE